LPKAIFYFTCIAFILASTASAKDYAGSYVLGNETGAITLTLQKDESAGYRGNLTANGNTFDSGNQRGYVSVPGHGPVGYGF
jgi:hypothetical protein